jgi:cardiolipin synthase A/B
MSTDSNESPTSLDRWWSLVPRPVFSGGNRVQLLQGGDELFPAMCEAINQAQHEVWLATYIFHNDDTSLRVVDALGRAAERGVRVRVVVDGFGSKATLAQLKERWAHQSHPVGLFLRRKSQDDPSGVALAVFRPMHGWWSWLHPGQLRRLHQKLCVVDGRHAFVGGINIMDDRLDLRHGHSEQARLDFAVAVQGPVAQSVEQAVRAVWTRAWLGRDFGEELRALVRSNEPMRRVKRLVKELRMPRGEGLRRQPGPMPAVQTAFVLRDNLRQRRTIERSYIAALRNAQERVDLVSAYFYPATAFRRALCAAAERGVQVRVLLQGKLDYRIAGLAARVLYDELLSSGVQVFEYTPAFLHAKVALVDSHWATVGSSNIDPLSLLLNLEANVIVRDADFSRELASRVEQALAVSKQVTKASLGGKGLFPVLTRGLVAWAAHVYLRLAGASGKY